MWVLSVCKKTHKLSPWQGKGQPTPLLLLQSVSMLTVGEISCLVPLGFSADWFCVYSFHSDSSKYLLGTVPDSREPV